MRQTLWKILAVSVIIVLAGCVQQARPAVSSPTTAPAPVISLSPSPSPTPVPTPLSAKLDSRVNYTKLERGLFDKLSKGFDPSASFDVVILLSQQNFSTGMTKLRTAGVGIKSVYGNVVLASVPASAFNDVLLMPEVQYVELAKR